MSRSLHVVPTSWSIHAIGTPPRCLLVVGEDCELSVIDLSRLADKDETVREECKSHIARASQDWGFFQDDLVEKSSQGSFTQQGRDDILATAIGRPKKPGYVRGVGGGVGIKQFFGGATQRVTLAQLTESDQKVLRNEFKKELFPELRDELLSEIKSEIASLGLAIQGPPKGAPPVVAITKGICPLPEESGDGVDVPVDYISKKTNIVTPPQPPLSPLQQLGASVVTMGSKTIVIHMPPELTCKTGTTTLFVCHTDICEIVIGNDLLSTTVLRVWNLYLHHLSIERKNATIYGFLDPVIIQSVGNKSEEVKKYLTEMFEKASKEVYLSTQILNSWSMEAISRLWGIPSVSRKKMQIVTPNVREVDLCSVFYDFAILMRNWLVGLPKLIKATCYKCGYYVMKHMHTIICTNITDSWNKIFNDSSPMEAPDIEDIRTKWASFILSVSKL
ncbi:hypothetical protein LR48_Vigan01g077100 [Vigna angularis]|uniref:Non-haem dioxygenase N-terminal domain-containing protein n=1 Tax=Phaseolus angularis TaxID=3914 RepID=A0A0L9TL61_PHAAN|nr:hypothetical protein LR48_Vigan01g077100 [Vigna angularis]